MRPWPCCEGEPAGVPGGASATAAPRGAACAGPLSCRDGGRPAVPAHPGVTAVWLLPVLQCGLVRLSAVSTDINFHDQSCPVDPHMHIFSDQCRSGKGSRESAVFSLALLGLPCSSVILNVRWHLAAQAKYWSCLRGLLPPEPPQLLHSPFRVMHGSSGAPATAAAAAGDEALPQRAPPIGGTDAFRSGSMMSEEVCQLPSANAVDAPFPALQRYRACSGSTSENLLCTWRNRNRDPFWLERF